MAGVFLTPVSTGVIALRPGTCSPATVVAAATLELPAIPVGAHIHATPHPRDSFLYLNTCDATVLFFACIYDNNSEIHLWPQWSLVEWTSMSRGSCCILDFTPDEAFSVMWPGGFVDVRVT